MNIHSLRSVNSAMLNCKHRKYTLSLQHTVYTEYRWEFYWIWQGYLDSCRLKQIPTLQFLFPINYCVQTKESLPVSACFALTVF